MIDTSALVALERAPVALGPGLEALDEELVLPAIVYAELLWRSAGAGSDCRG